MRNSIRKTFYSILGAGFLITTSAFFMPSSQSQAQTIDKGEIESIIQEYLLKNPEILHDMQRVLEDRQQQELVESQQNTLEGRKEKIYNSKYQIEFGNPDAKLTVVEFFDYNCGFCQRALDDMNRLLENNEDIRFVLKEYPVLGEASFEASRVSLAFATLLPEKHPEYHVNLLGMPGQKNGERAIELAVEMGVSEEAIRAEIDKPYIMEGIREVYQLSDGLGINGTPSYIVGNEVVFGAVGYDQLQQKISQLEN